MRDIDSYDGWHLLKVSVRIKNWPGPMQPGNISLKGNTSISFRWNLKRDSHAQTSVRATGAYARLATDSPLAQGYCADHLWGVGIAKLTFCTLKIGREDSPTGFSGTLLSFVRRKARSTCIARFNLSEEGSSPSNMLRPVDDRLHTRLRNVHVESVSPIFVILFPDLP